MNVSKRKFLRKKKKKEKKASLLKRKSTNANAQKLKLRELIPTKHTHQIDKIRNMVEVR